MEIPNLGKHCCIIGCNRLDFLPLKCECGKMFCTDHFLDHTAGCEVFKKSKLQESNTNKPTYPCNFEGCSDISLFHFPCKKCGLHYCISHRHHKTCDLSEEELEKERKKWNLPIEQYNKAKEQLDTQLHRNAMKMQPDSKKSKMSNKIQLMRLKGKATGPKDIPTQDRIYFLIYKPIGTDSKTVSEKSQNATQEPEASGVAQSKPKSETVAVFVSKMWSIGKCIDSISQLCKVVNNNNKTNENKLRLFRASDGLIICTAMSKRIVSILDNTIKDGESLILEYIDNAKSTSTEECYLVHKSMYME